MRLWLGKLGVKVAVTLAALVILGAVIGTPSKPAESPRAAVASYRERVKAYEYLAARRAVPRNGRERLCPLTPGRGSGAICAALKTTAR
jgi:hypothetical protein